MQPNSCIPLHPPSPCQHAPWPAHSLPETPSLPPRNAPVSAKLNCPRSAALPALASTVGPTLLLANVVPTTAALAQGCQSEVPDCRPWIAPSVSSRMGCFEERVYRQLKILFCLCREVKDGVREMSKEQIKSLSI